MGNPTLISFLQYVQSEVATKSAINEFVNYRDSQVCYDLRLVQIRTEAAPSELIPERSTANQFDLQCIYSLTSSL
jgi:hypothetical protein